MYDILKSLSVVNNWVFDYGRSDFQNLHDSEEQKEVVYLFLDPVGIKKKKNDSNVEESRVFYGSFMMLYSSDLDEASYEDRYNDYIKPIINKEVEKVEEELSCEYEVDFEEWDIVEVINVLDYNLDGVIVTYRVDFEVDNVPKEDEE